MGTYRNYKCGNCNKSLSGGYQPSGAVENFSRLGPETFLCPYCTTPNKTNRIPFYQMGILEKGWIIFLIITSVSLFSFTISFILSAIATIYVD